MTEGLQVTVFATEYSVRNKGSNGSVKVEQDAVFQLPEQDRTQGQIALMTPEPPNHPRVRRRLRRLAQDISVCQQFHSVAVDSEAIG